METVASRLRKVFTGETPDDRLPRIEWATWWHLTVQAWEAEGLPCGLSVSDLHRYWGLDPHEQLWIWPMDGSGTPPDGRRFWIETADDYQAMKHLLFPRTWWFDESVWGAQGRRQSEGQQANWVTFQGFFWWPRVLMGVENHFTAFYDLPEVMHEINQGLAYHIVFALHKACEVFQPTWATLAEDMAYNHGPMIGKNLFDEFIAPYYRQIVPVFKELGVPLIVDTDGQCEPMLGWLEEVGVDGCLPMEARAGVDVARVRAEHPDLAMVGGFDKTAMYGSPEELDQEFARMLPVARLRRFVPSVDHQTPPMVSMAQYRTYLEGLEDLCLRAVR